MIERIFLAALATVSSASPILVTITVHRTKQKPIVLAWRLGYLGRGLGLDGIPSRFGKWRFQLLIIYLRVSTLF